MWRLRTFSPRAYVHNACACCVHGTCPRFMLAPRPGFGLSEHVWRLTGSQVPFLREVLNANEHQFPNRRLFFERIASQMQRDYVDPRDTVRGFDHPNGGGLVLVTKGALTHAGTVTDTRKQEHTWRVASVVDCTGRARNNHLFARGRRPQLLSLIALLSPFGDTSVPAIRINRC